LGAFPIIKTIKLKKIDLKKSNYNNITRATMTLTYRERINVKHAKYLLSLPVETLIEIVTDDNNDNGVDWDDGWNNPKAYAHQIRNWLKGAITSMEAKGNITTKYKFSKTLVKCGRIYVNGFGIQK